jgi:hypothetical protein
MNKPMSPRPDAGPNAWRPWLGSPQLAFRCMLTAWVVLALLMCLRTALWPTRNSVYPIFSDAGRGWLAGTDLYDQHFWQLQIDEFRYSPLVAASFVPVSLLPDAVGGVLWRLANMGIFFAGMVAFCRVVYPGGTRIGLVGATCMGWLLIPLGLPSFNNGQANPVVIGSLLLAVVAAYRGRWNLAAIALAWPILFKVYPLAVALLLLLVYPRQLGWRLGLLLILGLLLPFALQDPSYVSRQYADWFAKLAREDRTNRMLPDTYRDFWLLVRWTHLPIAHHWYPPLQLAVAGGIALVVVVGRLWRWQPTTLLFHLVNLGCCWMLLFGPATENSTYILIAPTVVIAVWEAIVLPRPVWTRCALAAMVCIFLGSALITALPDGRNWAFPLNPLATLLLFGERLYSLRASGVRVQERAVVASTPARAA